MILKNKHPHSFIVPIEVIICSGIVIYDTNDKIQLIIFGIIIVKQYGSIDWGVARHTVISKQNS